MLTAALFVGLAIGRLVDAGQVVTELGRDRARDSGWYGSRRGAQAIFVGTIASLWFVAVVVAVWRVPERRRRYLPMALVSATVVCFAAVRLISLHHVDAVLYRRSLSGLRLVLFIEYGLLRLAGGAIAWRWWSDRRAQSSDRQALNVAQRPTEVRAPHPARPRRETTGLKRLVKPMRWPLQ